MQTWKEALNEEKAQPYFKDILLHVEQERAAGKQIFIPNLPTLR